MRVYGVTRVRPRMGTLLAVTLRTEAGTEPRAFGVTFELARRAEALLSVHAPASALSEMNRSAGRAAVVSRELAGAIRAARALAEATEGAFDPTIGAVLRVWRRAARSGREPSRGAVARARSAVDWRALEIAGHRTWITRRGVSVDGGAFGKGVALDGIARVLARNAVSGVLNFGESSLRVVGTPPREGWPVLLRHPASGFAGQFVLRHGACSTSATYGQHAAIGARVIGHVFDPRTGTPVRAHAQVTVLAPSATVAEAASTALLVLGPDALHRIAMRLSVEACWIDRKHVRTTPGFALRTVA
jgi:thiamine biosynthesis lipoprotein